MKRILLLAALATFASGYAMADLLPPSDVDPATLHIGTGAGTSGAQGDGAHPNIITDRDNLNIFQNSGGANTINVQYLIVGAPNINDPLGLPSIASVTSYNPYPDTYPGGGVPGTVEATVNPVLADQLDPGEEVYTELGAAPSANNSNSFTNWAGWNADQLGITANFFGLYVYQINAELGPKGLIDIVFDDVLPVGSIAIAYGIDADGKAFSTPFTQAGGIVPEPSTLLLFGAGLAGAAFAGRRRRKVT